MRFLILTLVALLSVAALSTEASAQVQPELRDLPPVALDVPDQRARFRRRAAGGALLGATLMGGAAIAATFSTLFGTRLTDGAAIAIAITVPTIAGIFGASLGALLARTVHPLRYAHALLGATVGVLSSGLIMLAFVPSLIGDGSYAGIAVGIPLGLAAIAGLTAFLSVRLTRREHASVAIAVGLGSAQLTSRF